MVYTMVSWQDRKKGPASRGGKGPLMRPMRLLVTSKYPSGSSIQEKYQRKRFARSKPILASNKEGNEMEY